jgi:7-keto-8-aminopelargonate synthetase-like enzyme
MKRNVRSLLEELRQVEVERQALLQETARATKNPKRETFDFSEMDSYCEVKIARSTGKSLSIESPFFRKVEDVHGTKVKINGLWVENFASYDYLGLNQSDAIAAAVVSGLEKWGVSATASRLVGGNRTYHQELERLIADFLHLDDAVVMVSGHATNVATINTLVDQEDLVLVDSMAHNSIYEGIKSAHTKHISFPHNDFAWVDRKLSELRTSFRHVLIVIEGLYSMHGDVPEVKKFIDVKKKHGAWLMIDEAHSIGVVGDTGRGICEEQAVEHSEVEVIMGTLSKSLCSCGGFIAGSAALVDLLRYRAPGFVYSVGMSAPDAYAAIASLTTLVAEPERVSRLRQRSAYFRDRAVDAGLDCGDSAGFAVAPVMIGDSIKAVVVSNRMLEAGFNVLPIISPGVPNRLACLRFFITSEHTIEVIDTVVKTLARAIDDYELLDAKRIESTQLQ